MSDTHDQHVKPLWQFTWRGWVLLAILVFVAWFTLLHPRPTHAVIVTAHWLGGNDLVTFTTAMWTGAQSFDWEWLSGFWRMPLPWYLSLPLHMGFAATMALSVAMALHPRRYAYWPVLLIAWSLLAWPSIMLSGWLFGTTLSVTWTAVSAMSGALVWLAVRSVWPALAMTALIVIGWFIEAGPLVFDWQALGPTFNFVVQARQIVAPFWLPAWFAVCLTWAISARRHAIRRVGCCTKCGYDLRGLSGALCPECGRLTNTSS